MRLIQIWIDGLLMTCVDDKTAQDNINDANSMGYEVIDLRPIKVVITTK